MCISDTGCCIFVLLRERLLVVAYNFAKVQKIRCVASSQKVFWYGSMEWNMEENFGMEWKIFRMNGNGMEENCQHGIWKNHLPFLTKPCCQVSVLARLMSR